MALTLMRLALVVITVVLISAVEGRILRMFDSVHGRIAIERQNTVVEVTHHLRLRRQTSGLPVKHGDYLFKNDGNNYAIIHYSGNASPVIFVLTYNNLTSPTRTNVYRSTDYGATFTNITGQLNPGGGGQLVLWSNFHIGIDTKFVVFVDAHRPAIYYTPDEGSTWYMRTFTPSSINPHSLLWNPVHDDWIIAHDSINNYIYVTQDLGQNWLKIAENVAQPTDYQWGDPAYDADSSVIYYNSYDPQDVNRGKYTVGLYTQRQPYLDEQRREFDSSLGRHDDFLLLGPYIFAQRNDSNNIHLYISYNRRPFKKAMIPDTDPHLGYRVTHINGLQAMVIVEHASNHFNLYLSDITGEMFSLSLADIVIVSGRLDLSVIDGINGTMVANQYVRAVPGKVTVRTVITLDNGGEWNLVPAPLVSLSGDQLYCNIPTCSLHFQMYSGQYARLGVYSQDSAPGIIVVHGNTGTALSGSPSLYISRDGGVTWSETLEGSWGLTFVDHGGLLVAAKDYHAQSSNVLKYSCDEGMSWNDYQFINGNMTVYGVITEPGEETTTVSLYGVKSGTATWDVVTINFTSIFPNKCTPADFYFWKPSDVRAKTDCILGMAVTFERRIPQRCCLIGINYDRPQSFQVCNCSVDDYECDYGFKPSEDFSGQCIRDETVTLQDQCVKTVWKSHGYRKIAGDVCKSGLPDYEPYEYSCPSVSCKSMEVGLSIAVVLAVIFGVIAVVFIILYCKLLSKSGSIGVRVPRMNFSGNSSESHHLFSGPDDDDDPPLAL